MDTLKITTCLASNTSVAGRRITSYVSQRLGIMAEFVDDIPWQERERRLDAGDIHVGWICGLLYVWKLDQANPKLELLAAPVMNADRYQDRPVYFSDVIARRDSRFRTFADLRGAVWAFNESRSYSGFYLPCSYLATLRESLGFFGQTIETGAHLNSIQMVLDGQADTTAIDSTLLEFELQRRPNLSSQIRTIQTLGPSPVPPWVISRKLPLELRDTLQQVLLQMHEDPLGQNALASCQMNRFAPVHDKGYDAVRGVVRQVEKLVS